MRNVLRLSVLFPLLALVFSAPLVAQGPRGPMDLSGEWAPLFHEDQPERIPGPDIGDYLGLPINEAVAFTKRYASDDGARLVNGILGRIQREAA